MYAVTLSCSVARVALNPMARLVVWLLPSASPKPNEVLICQLCSTPGCRLCSYAVSSDWERIVGAPAKGMRWGAPVVGATTRSVPSVVTAPPTVMPCGVTTYSGPGEVICRMDGHFSVIVPGPGSVAL